MPLAVHQVAPHEGEPGAREDHNSVITCPEKVSLTIRCGYNGAVRTMIFFFMVLSFSKRLREVRIKSIDKRSLHCVANDDEVNHGIPVCSKFRVPTINDVKRKATVCTIDQLLSVRYYTCVCTVQRHSDSIYNKFGCHFPLVSIYSI
jgi:hypothetical protein